MKWFEGGIAEAVASSQANKAVFLVAIFGADEASTTLEQALESEDVLPVVSSPSDFVCIRLDADSDPHKAFSQIYTNAQSPSIYCVTAKAVPVDIIRPPITAAELKKRLEFALARHRQITAATPVASPTNSTTAANVNAAIASAPQIATPSGLPATSSTRAGSQEPSRSSSVPDARPASSSKPATQKDDGNDGNDGEGGPEGEVSFEEKVRRAKELALARQLKKQKEEEEEEKRREIERRQAGKGAAELKRWQDEQETKRAMEERRKDKEAEKALRQKLLEQIAQDRAARNSKTNAEYAEQGPSTVTQRPAVTTAAPVNYSGQARLSFRLPDGSSQTHVFEPDSTLGHVRQYIIDHGNLPFKDFSLWVAFPRKQFTITEYGSSLRSLGLLPSAALLILPNSGSAGTAGVASVGSLWTLIAALLGYVVIPFTFIWSIAQRALPSSSSGSTTGAAPPKRPSGDNRDERRVNKLGRREDGGQADSQAGGSESSSKPRDVSNQSSSRGQEKGKSPSGKVSEGNVHRLRTSESDSDEEKATWNGNSTQQM